MDWTAHRTCSAMVAAEAAGEVAPEAAQPGQVWVWLL
jgi:hypothetical protein